MLEKFVFLEGQVDDRSLDPDLVAREVDDEVLDLQQVLVDRSVAVPQGQSQPRLQLPEAAGLDDEIADAKGEIQLEGRCFVADHDQRGALGSGIGAQPLDDRPGRGGLQIQEDDIHVLVQTE